MRGREGLEPLLDNGVIDAVLRPLMSGKEAQVWLVEAAGERRVAKIYKQAEHRSFKHRADYTEGRRVRSTRAMRAMQKGSRFGREQVEAAWRSAEVDAIYRLRAAGVRVPEPHDFVDGVLVMELVTGDDGEPAPRLADVNLTRDEAEAMHEVVIREIVKMLCAGLVHGDLSDFNILLGPDGPVIIDFPQAVDAAGNANARKLLLRDVKNVSSFFGRWSKRLRKTRYGPEMWALYERGELRPDSPLTGKHRESSSGADVDAIIAEIRAAEEAEQARREALGLPERRRARTPKAADGPTPTPIGEDGKRSRKGKRSKKGRGSQDRPAPEASRTDSPPTRGSGEGGSGSRKKKRRRRKRRGGDRPPEPTPRAPEPPADPFDDLDALLSED